MHFFSSFWLKEEKLTFVIVVDKTAVKSTNMKMQPGLHCFQTCNERKWTDYLESLNKYRWTKYN